MIKIIFLIIGTDAIWPQSYRVRFTDGDVFQLTERQPSPELEMIQENQHKAREDDMEFKMSGFHRYIEKLQSAQKKRDLEEYYETTVEKNAFTPVYTTKRDEPQEKTTPTTTDYDYDELKHEYDEELLSEANLKKETKQDDKEAWTCTVEESRFFGIDALKCLWKEIRKPQYIRRAWPFLARLSLVVICVVSFIWLICLCEFGVCRFCFWCRWCDCRYRIQEVLHFYKENPPGIFHKEGQVLEYVPTDAEIAAYDELKDEIMKMV